MNNKIIKIAELFTPYPGGRYSVGKNDSGQEFRDSILFPELKKAIEGGYILIIDLDGVAGYSSSFLDEAFGGLVREYHMDKGTLAKTMNLVSEEDPYCIDEIMEYIENAASSK